MLRLGTAWLMACTWFLALICEFVIYLFVRDTELYGGGADPCQQPRDEPAQSAPDITSQPEIERPGWEEELSLWRAERRKKYPKYEKYLEEGRAEEQLSFLQERRRRMYTSPSCPLVRQQAEEAAIQEVKKGRDARKSDKKYERYRRRRKKEENKTAETQGQTAEKNTVDVNAANQLLTGDQSQQMTEPGAHVETGDGANAAGTLAEFGGGVEGDTGGVGGDTGGIGGDQGGDGGGAGGFDAGGGGSG